MHCSILFKLVAEYYTTGTYFDRYNRPLTEITLILWYFKVDKKCWNIKHKKILDINNDGHKKC